MDCVARLISQREAEKVGVSSCRQGRAACLKCDFSSSVLEPAGFEDWPCPDMVFLSVSMVAVTQRWEIKTNAIIIVYELIYLLPVIVVLWLKKADWRVLKLKRFSVENLMVGCGLLFAAYLVIVVHNLALMLFDIAPQSEYMAEIFGLDINLWVLGFSVVVVAPISEEIFFRSFIYAGLVDKAGWKKAAIISALIFGAAHMQLVAFIPTFLMGLVLAYVYQRSKSVIPSIILHFAVNAFGFAMVYISILLQDYLPLP